VALDKPSGVAVLKDRTEPTCLWDALPELLGGKPYQVHRIDKGTSGVLLVARTPEAQKTLSNAFRDRLVRKYYLAWVSGTVESPCSIDLPLRRGRKSRYRVAGQRADIVHEDGQWRLSRPSGAEGVSAFTRVRPLKTVGNRSLVLLQPRTGRTHQLRVHLSWIGHPILGDHLYGQPDAPAQRAPRLQLHCHRLVVPGVGSFTAAKADDWLS
jgi:23S rRNA-/tRNA-specific pseudouridylate synthase